MIHNRIHCSTKNNINLKFQTLKSPILHSIETKDDKRLMQIITLSFYLFTYDMDYTWIAPYIINDN